MFLPILHMYVIQCKPNVVFVLNPIRCPIVNWTIPKYKLTDFIAILIYPPFYSQAPVASSPSHCHPTTQTTTWALHQPRPSRTIAPCPPLGPRPDRSSSNTSPRRQPQWPRRRLCTCPSTSSAVWPCWEEDISEKYVWFLLVWNICS